MMMRYPDRIVTPIFDTSPLFRIFVVLYEEIYRSAFRFSPSRVVTFNLIKKRGLRGGRPHRLAHPLLVAEGEVTLLRTF
ncbi:unnamed protein product [Calypogeia fissa]